MDRHCPQKVNPKLTGLTHMSCNLLDGKWHLYFNMLHMASEGTKSIFIWREANSNIYFHSSMWEFAKSEAVT